MRTITTFQKMSSTPTARLSGGRSTTVILGAAVNTVSDPMTVAGYLAICATFLDSRRFGKIEDVHGSLALFHTSGEELLTRDGEWVRRWKQCVRRVMATLRTVGVNNFMPILKCHYEDD